MINLKDSKNFLSEKLKNLTPEAKGISSSILKIVKRDLKNRLDYKLLNMKLAKNFADCFHMIGNEKKAYSILVKAWAESEKSIDEVLECYFKYAIYRTNLKSFLERGETQKYSTESTSLFNH